MSESPETTPLSAEDRVRELLAAGQAFVTARGIDRTAAEHALRRAVMATWGWEPDAARDTVPAKAVPAADEDRERLADATKRTGWFCDDDEHRSAVFDNRQCYCEKVADAIMAAGFRAGVSPSTGDDRLRARIEALDTIRPDWPDGADYVNRDDVLRALSTGAPDTEEQP